MYNFFAQFNQIFVFYLVFPLIVAFSLFLTIRLKCLQITKIKLSALTLLKSRTETVKGISHYQAISAVIAGNLGTGNISGMAVALATGGPGSLVWMWIMAFLGSSIQYGSCYLGSKYRVQKPSGEYVGGPMYYLKNGLGWKKLAVGFSLLTMIAAILVGNFAQVNSMVLPLQLMGLDPFICSLVLLVLSALVLLGGMQRIAKVASAVVPVMALLYIGAGSFILVVYKSEVLPALALMWKSAFHLSSFTGGALGFGLMKALTVGFERGLFATDAGTGIVPILQSGTRSQSPALDAVATLVAPFIVMFVCTMTGLILIVSGAYDQAGLQSTNMVVYAFQKVFGEGLGIGIVFSALALFAYTTLLAWGGCGEKAAEFLWGKGKVKVFQCVYLALIPVGAVAWVDLIWVLADCSITLMLVTNLAGIVGLSKEVVTGSLEYFQRKKPA